MTIEQLIGLAGALCAGGLLQHLFARFWLTRKDETDVAAALRTEMREALTLLTNRIDKQQQELDNWRDKYFHLLEEHTILKMENIKLRAELDLINPKPVLYRQLPNHTPQIVS